MTTELLVGGVVYSPAAPDATAMAVTDGIVVWVGSDDVGRALHPDAQVSDLNGRFVAPGFVDSHVHLTSTGLALGGLTLNDATGRSECVQRIAAHATTIEAGELIWGLGWDDSAWQHHVDPDERRFPTTSEVDAVVGNLPVYLARIDEHSAVASTALRRLVPDLADTTGFSAQEPLVAEAHHLVRGAARQLVTATQRTRAQRHALDHAAAHGVVAVHENGGPDISGLDDFLSLADLDHPVEVRRYWGQPVESVDHARELLAISHADGLAGDLFVDGAIGSHTAWLTEPYCDLPGNPGHTGISYLDRDTILTHVRACTEIGIQAGFHVIGDAATDVVVSVFDQLAAEFGTPALARCVHRVEHAEMVTSQQAAVLARCGVVASMQPMFDAAWGGPGDLYEQRLGAPRAAGLNNFAELAREGVILSFSSDAPVTDIDPWAAVRAAVHHHQPRNAISARGAFSAATRGGWRAGGVNDGLTGTLTPGAPASYAIWEVDDLVVAGSHESVQRWSTDPRSRVPALPDVSPGAALPRCVRTVHRGQVLFDGERG
ncbi:amidohydrolase [Gordonia sp. NPDC003424]